MGALETGKKIGSYYIHACHLPALGIEKVAGLPEDGPLTFMITVGIAIGVPIAGIWALVNEADDQLARFGIDLIQDAQQATQVFATQTPTPELMQQVVETATSTAATSTPVPSTPEYIWNCVDPVQLGDTAYSLAKELAGSSSPPGPPYKLIDRFANPDVEHILNELPRLIHPGDAFCIDP